MKALLILLCVDSEKVTAEVKGVFGHAEANRADGKLAPSHETLIERATRLCNELHSDPAKVAAKHSKGGRKRKRENVKAKQYQKNLVLIEFPGKHPSAVVPMREYEKVFDGSIRFSSIMDEDIREEIARVLRSKASVIHDLSGVTPEDFSFVKCANKKVRVPDGDPPFDAQGIIHTYPHGAIYVRLTKPMWKSKVCLTFNPVFDHN